jgi:hypothetical protein
MRRRRGGVQEDRDADVIEVGLDELLRIGYTDVPELGTDENEVDPGGGDDGPGDDTAVDAGTVDEWQADEPDLPGASFGAAFFGWLVAGGTAVLMLALAGAVVTLIGWHKLADWPDSGARAGWLHVGAWVVLVLSLGIGSFSGGYASGRMVPSDGARQGLEVWLFGWGAAALVVGFGYVADRRYDLIATIHWPTLPIAEADRTAAALAALLAIQLVTLLGAVLGGVAGVGRHARSSVTRRAGFRT